MFKQGGTAEYFGLSSLPLRRQSDGAFLIFEEVLGLLTQRPRGTADNLPGEVEKWQYLERIAEETFRKYHYREIRTPIFEHTELFARGVGETTDIVAKEMYTFVDRGDRSVTLRPEGTAGVVRAYVEDKLYGNPGTEKLYYIGPMFRYEKPQKGRLRQFHQYGCEVLGSEGPAVDAEVIALNVDFLSQLGVKDMTVELNSVGCPVCRPKHREQMIEKLLPRKDELCRDCQQRLERNPLRIFDCKNEHCQWILKDSGAPTILDSLCDDCSTHFHAVEGYLKEMDLNYVINPKLVRGLDYYTRSAWEITVEGIGTIAGGGRYNGLVEQIGGPETPGIGFAGGVERALITLDEQGFQWPKLDFVDVFVAVAQNAAEPLAMRFLQAVRGAGFIADRDYTGRGLKAQFKAADRASAKYVAVFGDSELMNGTVTLKDLRTGEQQEVPFDEALSRLAKE